MSQFNVAARESALSVLDGSRATPTSLIDYQSNGRVIVIGEDSALAYCRQWPETSNVTLLSNAGKQVEIEGYLGAFSVELNDSEGSRQSLQADIVLDLNPEPINRNEILPPGYLHARISDENVADIELQVAELIGEFEKPKYFNYDPSICAHSVNGVTVCSRCIDACPAGAIESAGNQIEITPFLCQGGGTCATVCPSGAVQYAYPSLADSGNQVRKMLKAYRQAQGEQAVVLFHSGAFSPEALMQQHENILPVPVEELASVGMELCLSALAYGASQVFLIRDEEVPELSLKNLQRQVDWMQVLLGNIGFNPRQLGIQSASDPLSLIDKPTSVEPAIHSMADGKRNAFYQALDHLVARFDCGDVIADLPAGAPFGTVVIDEARCTLCMACIGSCPGRALQDGSNREVPEVFFIENHCIQCGACTQTCPEQAITLVPRLVFGRESRNHSRALNRDQPFCCIDCGKPFAPSSVIDKMLAQLKDHYMFNSPRALDRLKMCEDCRVVDIVQDPEAMKGKFDPLN
ncbi:MAG: 4Fe-4S binding protein [Gammaproteobacteria bacterium]|nr:4Fe-4S binding protein [Gammaproteobacteria bacterium]